MKSLFTLPNVLRCTFISKSWIINTFMFQIVTVLQKVLVKESITFVSSHRKVILVLLIERTYSKELKSKV